MLFNSIEYLIFFPLVVIAYFCLPPRYRWILLLAASYYFYMSWRVEYIILIIISTLIDYYAGLKMSDLPDRKSRRPYLMLSVLSNLGILIGFKYFNFFNDSFRSLFDYLNLPYLIPALNVLLPVGISFYTFQTLSYSIDIYKGEAKAERHLGIFALYVSFFPQLVAGPIERSQNLLPQFRINHQFEYDKVVLGLRQILIGFFKKVVIADRLGYYVNEVYNHPSDHEGLSVLIASYFFAFQIYCDFSGYSDIAIGSARVMGYDLMENFRQPYYSKSIREFWQRWHISLSTWFRDYVYIPLGGNRVVVWRWYYNLFITFLLSGLWHGANWTFVFWGALHGIYLILGILLNKSTTESSVRTSISPVVNIFKMFFTFHLVVLGWIFFRANNLNDAFLIIKNLFVFSSKNSFLINIVNDSYYILLCIIGICIVLLIDYLQIKNNNQDIFFGKSVPSRWLAYILLITAIVIFGVFGKEEFIYFQF